MNAPVLSIEVRFAAEVIDQLVRSSSQNEVRALLQSVKVSVIPSKPTAESAAEPEFFTTDPELVTEPQLGSEDEIDAEQELPAERRKRGRPPKIVRPSKSKSKSATVHDVPMVHKKLGRPPKSKSATVHDVPMVHKKRGRPSSKERLETPAAAALMTLLIQ